MTEILIKWILKEKEIWIPFYQDASWPVGIPFPPYSSYHLCRPRKFQNKSYGKFWNKSYCHIFFIRQWILLIYYLFTLLIETIQIIIFLVMEIYSRFISIPYTHKRANIHFSQFLLKGDLLFRLKLSSLNRLRKETMFYSFDIYISPPSLAYHVESTDWTWNWIKFLSLILFLLTQNMSL